MIESDKTKGSAIADSNSVRGMTDLHCCILSKFKLCEGGKMSFVKRMKKKFGREQEMEVRKENSRLNLQKYGFLFSDEREIQSYHVAFGEQMLLLVRVF